MIGGWLRGDIGRADRLGALLVGHRDEHGCLRHVGKVGMGYSDADRSELRSRLERIKRDESPFAGWTSSGMLRHPSYKGPREDVAPGDVVRERKQTEVEVDGRRLRLTNLRKVLYPEAGFTEAHRSCTTTRGSRRPCSPTSTTAR